MRIAIMALAAALSLAPARAGEAGEGPPSFQTITPIFSELVMVTLPAGFKTAFENVNGGSYIREAVLVGETVDRWTEMVTLTGAQDLAKKSDLDPDDVIDEIAKGFKKACPETFATSDLGEIEFDDYDAHAAIVGCGAVGGHSEVAMIIAVEGSADYYTIQWAERGAPLDGPPEFDESVWSERRERLKPIRICERVPGENAPFPSCAAGE
ncbi:MAG: hypothetical protein NW216_08760 [Hyphomicrobium sp.]|nr:hypothetical protein [Hyphomicrobium sp.]